LILLPDADKLTLQAASPDIHADENELAVADWCYRNGEPAGRGTETLPAAEIWFQPLKTARGTVGVLGVRPSGSENQLLTEQRVLMVAFSNLAALAIERAAFAEKAAQSEVLRSTEKLQAALLNSISHELRTPLASITGVLTSLGESEQTSESGERLDLSTRIELIDSATHQAERLNRLVENLLNMTRLESGAFRLNLQPLDLQDVINTVLSQKPAFGKEHTVDLQIPLDLPLVQGDPLLIAQVVSNLLDNAFKYSPPGSRVMVSANALADSVEIAVIDQGTGVDPEDLERIFDKFYRIQSRAQITGTGLGLSICRGIIEAHGGRIWARNNPQGGLSILFSLPARINGETVHE
jgi:two-component system sensor histidine kinase KdpD